MRKNNCTHIDRLLAMSTSSSPLNLRRQHSAPTSGGSGSAVAASGGSSSSFSASSPSAADESRRQAEATRKRFGVVEQAQALRRMKSAGAAPGRRATPSSVSKAVRAPFFNSRGQSRNRFRVKLGAYKKVQLKQLEKFRSQARSGAWASVHHAHFDWYCFPIEDGSQPRYNVLADDVAELSADDEWVERYLETVEIVTRAWGWDIRSHGPVEVKAKGMGWTNWDVRLAKMIRSLWIFGRKNEMESLQEFANFVKPRRGLRYGSICLDEVYDMRLDEEEE